MADVLLVTSGLRGMLYPTVELARRLRLAGHDVAYASVPEVRDEVERQGVEFLPLAASRYREFLDRDRSLGLAGRWMQVSERRRRAVDSLGLDDFARMLEQRKPELVLIDQEMHEEILVALRQTPVALLNSFVSIWRRPGLPPPHHRVIPGKGFWGSAAGLQLLWTQLRLRKAWRRTWQRLRLAGVDRVSVLKELANQRGVSFVAHADFSQWLMPLVLQGLPVLCLHGLELEFPHEPAANVHYLGPLIAPARLASAQARAEAVDSDQRGRLEAIYQQRQDSGGERKLIYAGFGSFFTADRQFLGRLFECFAERPEWQLVLSLGGQARSEDWLPKALPDNVHVFVWVPQLEVLQQADVALVHGGTNTAEECLLSSVPMLVYCGHETDMAGTTARIEFHGLGIAGDRGRDSPAVIARHIERLLSEERFGHELEQMNHRYRRYSDGRVAEEIVESLLGSAGRP